MAEVLDVVKELNKKFRIALRANEVNRKYRKQCEEFYYNDVDQTLTEYTGTQKKNIKNTFNIPVSTKFVFAIIENYLAFLTATKPFPKLISTEESTQEFSIEYEKAWHATWSESQGNLLLTKALRDSMNTGDGYIIVRKANHIDEATLNVSLEYRNWKHIVIDPESREDDYSDASFIFIMDLMRVDKAQQLYDIVLTDDETHDVLYGTFDGISVAADLANDFYPIGYNTGDSIKYIWTRECYEKQDINVYIGNNEFTGDFGVVSNKRPKSIIIANPQVLIMQQQLQQCMMQLQQLMQQSQQTDANTNATTGIPNNSTPEGMAADGQNINQNQQVQDQSNQQIVQLKDQVVQIQQQMKLLPKTIPAFEMSKDEITDESGKKVIPKVIVTEVTKIKKRRILYTLLVGNNKIDSYYLPGDAYPIINFPFSHFQSPNKTYGVMHYIIDIARAMNKYLSDIMYDISVNGHRKGFIWEGTIVDPKQLEGDWAKTDSLIRLTPNPNLPDGGKPFILDPSPLNQSIQYMLTYFKTLIEYITGIYGIMQGDPSQAPNTMGATQSIQNFGSQRIKLYSRHLESSLENLVYVAVNFIQAYAPRDKIVKYFDTDNNPQSLQIMNNVEDIKFKVRVDFVNSLPTTRLQTAQALGFIAQTAGDPSLTALLTEYYLKICDVPEAKEIGEKMNIIKNMQQQLQQLQQQLEEQQGQVKQLTNNLTEQNIAQNVKDRTAEANQKIALTQQQSEMDAQNPETSNQENYSQLPTEIT